MLKNCRQPIRLAVLGVIVFAMASATGGGRAATPPGPTLFVSPNGSPGGSCGHSAPCNNFDRAYHVARPGDVVEVAGGTYPQQNIRADASKTSSEDVVF